MNRVGRLYRRMLSDLQTTDEAKRHHESFWEAAPIDEDSEVAEVVLAEGWLSRAHAAYLDYIKQQKAHA